MDKREIRQMMELLQIEDITTKRQLKNGTITWRLPIKIGSGNRNIEVGSFKSGYVRNNKSRRMKLNNTELNVLMVALDHMQEHLGEVSKDVDMSDKIVALKSLRIKLEKEIYEI